MPETHLERLREAMRRTAEDPASRTAVIAEPFEEPDELAVDVSHAVAAFWDEE